MAARRMPACLMLGLTRCLLAMTTAISVSRASGNVTLAPALTPTGAGAGGSVSSHLGGRGANGTREAWPTAPGNATAWQATQEDQSVPAPATASTTAPATTWTPATASATTPATAPATASATTPVTASATAPATASATASATAPATASATTPAGSRLSTSPKKALTPAFKVWAGPNRTGTLVFLMLLLILLIAIFCGAWSRLRAFSSSYYPCRLDKGLYVNPEEGEGSSRGPRSVGRAFIVAVRNLLPWKAGVREVELEEEEEEGWDEQSPGGGGSEGEADGESEGEAGRGSSRGEGRETDQSDSDDYSSLGGLDLRERAALAEGEEGDSAGPASACGQQLLGDLHSFSGTAGWTDTNQDITVL